MPVILSSHLANFSLSGWELHRTLVVHITIYNTQLLPVLRSNMYTRVLPMGIKHTDKNSHYVIVRPANDHWARYLIYRNGTVNLVCYLPNRNEYITIPITNPIPIPMINLYFALSLFSIVQNLFFMLYKSFKQTLLYQINLLYSDY